MRDRRANYRQLDRQRIGVDVNATGIEIRRNFCPQITNRKANAVHSIKQNACDLRVQLAKFDLWWQQFSGEVKHNICADAAQINKSLRAINRKAKRIAFNLDQTLHINHRRIDHSQRRPFERKATLTNAVRAGQHNQLTVSQTRRSNAVHLKASV